MYVLGLLMLLAAGVFAAGVALSNTSATTSPDIFGATVANISIGNLFVVGVITGFFGAIGLALVLMSSRRAGQRRRALRAERRDKQERERELAAENARLSAALEQGGPVSDARSETRVANSGTD